MPRYRVTVAYDGTAFAGWQVQKRETAARTVQGALEGALSRLAGDHPVRVAGAGRTDAGVHALGQSAAFDLPRDLAPGDLVRAMNALLDADVRALAAEQVAPGYNPRRAAHRKVYRYVMDVGPLQLPTRRRYAGHVRGRLDEKAVTEASGLYVGRHDFASLASTGSSVRTTVRTVYRSEVLFRKTPSIDGARTMIYEVEGDGFLRKMVRSMVGGLVAVGTGAYTVEGLGEALGRRDRGAWPPPADARGLTLVRVDEEGAVEALG